MKPANTLVILSDEHQARAMGCAGHPFVKTPNLDQLAARGLRFTNAVTPSPICVPARAAFATGQSVRHFMPDQFPTSAKNWRRSSASRCNPWCLLARPNAT